jgi:hypothetical protein
MSDTDPLAHERFRTILTDAFEWTPTDTGVDAACEIFPDAHFEHRTNDAGVRVRRVVVAGEWEVDPDAVPVGDSLGERPHAAEGCHNGGRPHLGPCVTLAPDGKPWLNPLDENETESHYDRNARLTAAREADSDVRD